MGVVVLSADCKNAFFHKLAKNWDGARATYGKFWQLTNKGEKLMSSDWAQIQDLSWSDIVDIYSGSKNTTLSIKEVKNCKNLILLAFIVTLLGKTCIRWRHPSSWAISNLKAFLGRSDQILTPFSSTFYIITFAK